MKKNSFVEGTFIATFAIILVKVLGVLYVIPFYRIIGEAGGSLYSYAYTVYNLFLNISTAGIPVAISKIITEYNALEKYEAKERAYHVGRNLILIISVIAFFMLFVFSKEFASLILGEIEGGNTLEDVSFVIKSVSFCLLIIPFLSVSKGYLQGHKYISPTSASEVIEQVVRVAVILMGSYITINVLNKSVTLGVGVAVLGSFIGGLVAYLFLKYKIHKNRELFKTAKEENKEITNKTIIKKIITYAVPIIITSIATDIYNLTDMTLIVRTSYRLGYTALESETIASIVATWAPKICMIINAVAMGMSVSLIPHMVDSFARGDLKTSNKKYNQAMSIIIVVALPMSIGLAFLSKPIYTLFYGESIYGPSILAFASISAFFSCIYIIMNNALQSLNKFKTSYISTLSGFLTNALLDVPLMYLFKYLGMNAFYGTILATICGYFLSYTISFSSLKKSFSFNYKDIAKTIKDVLLPSISMIVVLTVLSLVINTSSLTTLQNILVIVLFTIVGALIYLLISFKTGLLERTFGEEYINKLLMKLRIKK